MEFTHLTEMILEQVKSYGKKPAQYFKKSEKWEHYTWDEMGRQIEAISKALLVSGLEVQDRAAIYSLNKPEWNITDYGIMGVRGITTTIYATNSAPEAEYIVNDAETSIIFVGGQEQYENVLQFLPQNKFLKKVIVFDDTVSLADDNRIIHFKDFIKIGLDVKDELVYHTRFDEKSIDDIATIIYTSGTSGTPKGVMLSHANLLSQLKVLNPLFDLGPEDIELCFLPLSHSYQKSSTHWTQSNGVSVYYCENPKEIMEYFKDVRPTFMVGVPRLYEKMFATVYARLEEASNLRRKLFDWAIQTGKVFQYKKHSDKTISPWLNFKHNLARKLVLNKIREIMGGRLNFFSAGGAPLAKEIEEFFFAAGIFIAQGYGLTETSPVTSCNRMDKFKFGTPGTVVDICEVKIAGDGEILIKGENVMQGYFRKPEYTAEVLSADGWFSTGDIGHLDDEGFLHITDRKKDIIITAGGKNIAPQGIESLFGKDYYIEQIAVIGDKRKYITALVVPSFEALKEYAKDQGIPFASIAELLKNEKIVAFFTGRIEEITRPLARYEHIKKFVLLQDAFSQEKGEITPTLKLKRNILTENYSDQIETMYLEE